MAVRGKGEFVGGHMGQLVLIPTTFCQAKDVKVGEIVCSDTAVYLRVRDIASVTPTFRQLFRKTHHGAWVPGGGHLRGFENHSEFQRVVLEDGDILT